MDISVSSSGLTSYLQATNNAKGPLKGIQIKLGEDNQAEMAAYADLRERGIDFEGPIYVAGKIETAGSSRIRLDVSKAKAGLLSIPDDYIDKGESGLEAMVNEQLARMPGLDIETLEIDDGQLRFKGDFPKTASAR
jgi:hypothetical protein